MFCFMIFLSLIAMIRHLLPIINFIKVLNFKLIPVRIPQIVYASFEVLD